jgi:hypothetical protein
MAFSYGWGISFAAQRAKPRDERDDRNIAGRCLPAIKVFEMHLIPIWLTGPPALRSAVGQFEKESIS